MSSLWDRVANLFSKMDSKIYDMGEAELYNYVSTLTTNQAEVKKVMETISKVKGTRNGPVTKAQDKV